MNMKSSPLTASFNRNHILLGAALLVGSSHFALAASTTTPLTQSVIPLGNSVKVVGEADPSSIVHFQVALRLRGDADFKQRLAAGQRFSFSELDAAYLPAQKDHDAVVSWLRIQGLSVDATVPSRMVISASGRADAVTRALGVHFAQVVSENKPYVSADSVPQIPSALASIVLGINGLQPQLRAFPMIRPAVNGATPYYPSDFLNGYSANNLGTTGSGSTTAIVIDTFPKTSDLTSFWSKTGVSQSLSNITFIQAVAGTLPAPSGEETLDAETASSIAPAGKVRVYAAQSLAFSNLDTTFQRVISDLQAGVKITQVSISLGACETQVGSSQAQTDDNDFAVLSSLGASVFVSSGDSGSRECGGRTNTPAFYSTSPHVTAVGGTTLHLSGANETSETGWSGSGGGLSKLFAKPSFQSALSYSSRAVPDISADADPNTGALVILNGQSNQYGGTSLAAPMWAGFAGLINSARISAGKSTLGLLDTRIYPLLGSSNFRDITSGNNGGYSAGKGFDLVTGIGAPKISTLLPALVSQN